MLAALFAEEAADPQRRRYRRWIEQAVHIGVGAARMHLGGRAGSPQPGQDLDY